MALRRRPSGISLPGREIVNIPKARKGFIMRKKVSAIMAVALALGMLAGTQALAAPASDGLLRTAVIYDISTMDVAKTTDNYLIPMNVFDRLFETRLVDGTAKEVPSLCTDYTVSEDGLTYDFTIRDDVVFSNGSTLTASDVQYTFERLLKVGQDNMDIPEEVAGADAVESGEADSLEGFQVKDDTHFSITLSQPNAGFIAELSAPAMSVVDAETMESVKGFGTDPADTIGSGPYVVTEWVANDHYTLEYNPKYWGDEPTVKKAIVSIIPDASTQNLLFQSGDLDLIDLQSLDTAIVESTYKTVYADQVVSTPKVGMTFMIFNENQKYLKDVSVRKAISMAVDVDYMINGIYNGNANREAGIIPAGIWGHNDALEPAAYDPEGAKELLKEAGYKENEVTFELAMDTSSDGNIQLVCQNICDQLKKVGINANLKSYEHAAWLDLRGSGEMESFVATWGMDYNDPANIMYTFYGSEKNTKQRSLNYPDKEIIDRVAAAPSIIDDQEREAEYQALEEKIIGEDYAWLSLFESLHLYCIGDRVESFTPHWAGFTDFYVSGVVLK